MARYIQVSSEVAGDVESGALGPGDELPSIREAAHRYKTTSSTISRAYRHLADAGVIDIGDRRRSCVAVGGAAAARRMLGGQPTLRLAGSDDPGLDTVLRQAGRRDGRPPGQLPRPDQASEAPPTPRRSTCGGESRAS